jgi:hypothetical protein
MYRTRSQVDVRTAVTYNNVGYWALPKEPDRVGNQCNVGSWDFALSCLGVRREDHM